MSVLISGFDFRDWLLANDPALSRLRMAVRVTLAIVIAFLILLAIHMVIVPLPMAAFGLGIVLSIEGGVAVRDKGSTPQLVTRLFGCLVSLAVVALAAVLEDYRFASDFVFLVVIFFASLARVFGPRGFAIGMFAFSSYFIGAYFRPNLSELPLLAIGPVISALVGHVVRAVLLGDNWRKDLLRSLESVRGRINQILFKLRMIAADGMVEESERHELRQLEERLKDAVMMAESFIPRPRGGVFDAASDPAAEFAVGLFDAHLAAESAIVLSIQSPPPVALVDAVVESDDKALAAYEAALEGLEERPHTETAWALINLGKARSELSRVIALGQASGFAGIAGSVVADAPPKIDFSLANPVVRSTLQITLAATIAMIGGLALSRDRWFWAVLTSFLVFTNTNSRGDTAIKALQRSLGTAFGIAIGLGLATLLSAHLVLAVAVCVVCIFLAFYFLQTSYATMTFFISIVLCLVYGMTGVLTLELLGLRIEETLIGAVAGAGVSFFLFPSRTRGALDEALKNWFDALEGLLVAARNGKPNTELVMQSQKLEAAYRAVTVAARPFGSFWSVVTRPGHIRQTLAIFLGITYWARLLARSHVHAEAGELQHAFGEDIEQIKMAAGRGSDCFFVERKAAKSVPRHLPVSREGSKLAVEMIGSLLARLYP
ncbi:FUSC family protein [Rhizobium sp. BK251]|uniref:FUSC family protein n=1 Tax=Rhizobium sp. BK251 TaxID=2512125 RepID=UPI001044FACC|nr:FUSC family protein [Rhizobium sp. BK251]